MLIYKTVFQSTLPRGERPMEPGALPEIQWFQSTLPRGERRESSYLPEPITRVSIHAPTRGATMGLTAYLTQDAVFQSTLPRGERLMFWICMIFSPGFNPRSHEGSDLAKLVLFFCHYRFNPRSHEGSDGAV